MALHFGTPGLLEALVASGLPHGAVHVPGTAAATPVASLRDLQVVRKIGAGSFGVVLRVVSKQASRWCASNRPTATSIGGNGAGKTNQQRYTLAAL
eukprot:m.301906 g.301906  ORF g.301906 m.301906 type:complete len:96 (+) comp19570_c0_seq3:166-453(+)